MRRLLYILLLLSIPAIAGAADLDIHVFLDTDADGTLNDCPNPAHNAVGTSNTNELQFCNGGTSDRKVIGTATGRVASGTCTGGGGAVVDLSLAQGATGVDIDGDGTTELIFGFPNAAVWNLSPPSGKSASVEIHAGTYAKEGVECDLNCNKFGWGSSCDQSPDCWQGHVMMSGLGPNLADNGYGTSTYPTYVRGADMGGSVDTWDSDGDKIPDTEAGEPTSYPAILSGDFAGDGDAVYTGISCTVSGCTGDATMALYIGCGDEYGEMCDSDAAMGIAAGDPNSIDRHPVRWDTDGDGVVDYMPTERGDLVDYVTVKDLEFKGYAGGNTGARTTTGIGNLISLNGVGLGHSSAGTDGIVIDHIYVHTNQYQIGTNKTWMGVFHDVSNYYCADWTEIKESYIEQNNQTIWQMDSCDNCASGCPALIHDNRILVDVGSAESGSWIMYFKSVGQMPDTRPRSTRFYNNEVVILESAAAGYFIDLGIFGDANGDHGKGELWVYGNIFRQHPSVVNNWDTFWGNTDHEPADANENWKLYFFNNTMDASLNHFIWHAGTSPSGPWYQGTIMTEKNNAYFDASNAHQHGNDTTPVGGIYGPRVTTMRRANEYCVTDISNAKGGSACTVTTGETAFTDWFDGPDNPTVFAGLVSYAAASTGPLVGITANTACDPDGDGTAGVDYDGDGVNDATWTDIAGNTIECCTTGSAIDMGAIQSNSDSITGCPAGSSNNFRRSPIIGYSSPDHPIWAWPIPQTPEESSALQRATP